MVFSSLTFLFYFLPGALLFYYLSPKKLKNYVLLIVSLFFYAWGEPVYIFLMIFSALADYVHGLIIGKYRLISPVKARFALLSSIVINIGILSFFKYVDFLLTNVNLLFNVNIEPLNLPLPIGISFYTFQTLSYTIDVFRGRVSYQKNPFDLALYVCLFPQLIAGPIVRYEIIERELKSRTFSVSQFSEGVTYFIIGLGKKVLIANQIGQVATEIHALSASDLTILTAWLGIFAFGLQIYFDFSGYSDMAIGLGKMFGFNFPRNFNYPYISKNISEFWRRWHISLGSWFRDYIYIPLGGSRKGQLITYRNLFIVWAITGLWHGSSWNFVLWGLYFGVIIALEKAFLLKFLNKLPRFLQHSYLIFLILISWVLFAFEDIQVGFAYFRTMFSLGDSYLYDSLFLHYLLRNGVLIIIAIIATTPLLKSLFKRMVNHELGKIRFSTQIIFLLFLLASLFLVTAYLVDDAFNPFLYFRF